MTFDQLPLIVLTELIWALGGLAVTLIFTTLTLRAVFGLTLKDVVREVEDDQNAAVGATFFIVATTMGLLIGRALQAPVEEVTWPITVAWFAISLIVITVTYLPVAWLILKTAGKRFGETASQYLHREMVVEDNAALMWFLGGLLTQIALIVGHVTL